MPLTSRAEIVSMDWEGIRLKLMDASIQEIQKYMGRTLSISIKPYHEKRSGEANRYFHVLKDKMAEKVGITPLEMHNLLIAKTEFEDEDMPHIFLRDDIDWTTVRAMHLKPVDGSWDPDAGTIEYAVMRGTHTYDRAEMAMFLDMVVRDAEMMGIETKTPDEIAHMVSLIENTNH